MDGTSFAMFYQDLWGKCLGFAKKAEGDISEIISMEKEFTGHEKTSKLAVRDLDIEKHIKSTAECIVERLTHKASEVFAPKNGRLQISFDECWDKVRYVLCVDSSGNTDWSLFSPLEIWKQLEAEYGGKKGITKACMQTAKEIAEMFCVPNDRSVETKSGMAILSIPVRAGDYYYKEGGKGKSLFFGEKMRVTDCLLYLESFAQWAGLAGVLGANGQWESRIGWPLESIVVSREKFEFGQHITMTTFANKFEFRFSVEATEKLQFFLREFYFEEEGLVE